MSKRIILGIVFILLALGVLVSRAVTTTAKAVVTVHDLVQQRGTQRGIRLGARVSDLPIEYTTSPEFLLRFSVHDISAPGPSVPVVYRGIMPDTLKAGRDVILEGDFIDAKFVATSLLTQCPSKYEPPGGPSEPGSYPPSKERS